MQQNNMLQRYLLHISALILLATIGCEKDYLVKADYFYINNTDSKLLIVEYGTTIAPNDTFKLHLRTDGPKEISAEQYIPQFSILTVRYKDKCLFYDLYNKGKLGPLDIANYESNKQGVRYYDFTYIFKAEDFVTAESCE